MKLLHVSDTHLGYSEYNRIDPETGINQREQDFYNAWYQVVEGVEQHRPDIVLHAGDLFHTPRPSNRAIRVAMEGIQRITQKGIPFVVVAGNHETPRISRTGSIFETLDLFDNVYTVYNGRYERLRFDGVDFHCIPHCSLTEDLDRAIDSIAFEAEVQADVLITHGAWTGKETFGMGEFNEQRIPDLEGRVNHSFSYVALGHYHRPVAIRDHIRYCGSTERTSFNEHNSDCGYLLVDLSTQTYQYQSIVTRVMKQLPPLVCTGLAAQDIYDRLEGMMNPDFSGALLKLFLTDIEPHTFLKLDVTAIDSIFSDVFYLERQFSLAEDSRSRVAQHARIESLPMEFGRYLEQEEDVELDKDKLLRLASEYLSEGDPE